MLSQKIKNLIKKFDIIHGLFLFITIGLLIVLFHQIKKGSVVVPEQKPVIIYKDKEGNTHSQIVSTEVDKTTIELLTDSIARLIKGRNDIKEMTTFTQGIDTKFVKIPIYIDTNKNFNMEIEDNYISITAEGNTDQGIGTFRLKGVDTLIYVSYVDKHLFKANERKVELINRNPYIKVTSGSSITLREPKVIVAVGPQAGVGITSTGKLAPYIGIGVTLNLLSIKSK